MHKTESLVELLEEQLCKFGKQSDLSVQDLDSAYKAAKTIYYIEVAKAMKDEGYSEKYLGYSGDMDYLRNRWRMRPSDGSSYRSYGSRNMRHYSMSDERSALIDKMEDLKETAATNSERETIQRCINQIVNDQ